MSIQFSAKALTPPIGKMLRIFPAGALSQRERDISCEAGNDC